MFPQLRNYLNNLLSSQPDTLPSPKSTESALLREPVRTVNAIQVVRQPASLSSPQARVHDSRDGTLSGPPPQTPDSPWIIERVTDIEPEPEAGTSTGSLALLAPAGTEGDIVAGSSQQPLSTADFSELSFRRRGLSSVSQNISTGRHSDESFQCAGLPLSRASDQAFNGEALGSPLRSRKESINTPNLPTSNSFRRNFNRRASLQTTCPMPSSRHSKRSVDLSSVRFSEESFQCAGLASSRASVGSSTCKSVSSRAGSQKMEKIPWFTPLTKLKSDTSSSSQENVEETPKAPSVCKSRRNKNILNLKIDTSKLKNRP
ncbi:hypothetical protein O181_026174 [Austropuccinia psidii MF-1]|uniref:Uncharacterized protein n=1 Tax=Austropuccinia psidii MF-1 TaxID=1389203 RepID=A0A9Q3H1D2_9BASI|nr:hypothetical protein [Austropuccinia psidii MF-1]